MPRGVPNSPEFERVARIPRRTPVTQAGAAELLSQHLRRPGSTATLRPIQAAALYDLHDNLDAGGRGLFGPIAVGAGKALICCLAGTMLPADKPCKNLVWLVPANLVPQCENVARQVQKDWNVPYKVHVVSYETLSSPRNGDVLERLIPDVIACDEAHKLRGSSVRTKRFKRYLNDRIKHDDAPAVLFLSGTITARSLFDFTWMLYYTHDKLNCPVPTHYPTLKDWDSALGVHKHGGFTTPLAPGVLQYLTTGDETPRQGFRRRLIDTLGCVGTTETACDTALYVHSTKPTVPENVEAALKDLRRYGRTPYGLVFDDPLAEARYLRQLALGYYLKWRWPNDQPDQAWLDARANWALELRALLRSRSAPGMDSPMLMTKAVLAGKVPAQYLIPWQREQQRLGDPPLTDAVWISNYAVEAALAQTQQLGEAGILWYQGIPFGDALRKHLPVFAGGDDRALDTLATGKTAGTKWIACSIQAHGTGKNLQAWHTGLVVSPPSSGQITEQLLGRLHRPGQAADEVNWHIWQATLEQRAALASARVDAEYLQTMQGPQKLLQATYL